MALTELERRSYVGVRSWLKYHYYQQREQDYIKGGRGSALSKVRTIKETTVPRSWSRFLELDAIRRADKAAAEQSLKLKVGQAVLFACAEAQSAYIWDRLYSVKGAKSHADVRKAAIGSFTEMDQAIDRVKFGERRLPDSKLLTRHLDYVSDTLYMSDQSSLHVDERLCMLTGLAVVTFRHGMLDKGHVLLPDPSLPLGTVKPWMPPATEMSQEQATFIDLREQFRNL